MRRVLIGIATGMLLASSSTQSRAETLGTLTLDVLSFLAFGDEPAIPLPAGSTVVFRFSDPAENGSIAFTIRPEDVSIPAVASADGLTLLKYSLKNVTNGTISAPGPNGRVISFTGTISATAGEEATSAYNYTLPFTTETVAARDMLGTNRVEVTGLRLVEGAWYAQLVGATTNKVNAIPAPGTAVYFVLSGQFDQLPGD